MHPYNLRPVSEMSHSPSSHSSGTPPTDMSPPPAHLPPIQQQSSPQGQHPRRPFSPSHLPHVDVSSGQSTTPRIYPPPPTGHELMRLFPPLPPDQFSMLKPGPTSVFFHRQERQFFAQAGKEIIRVRVESDFPPPDRASKGKEAATAATRPWTATQHQSPLQAMPPPPPQHHQHHPAQAPMPPPYTHHAEISRGMPGPAPPPGVAPPVYGAPPPQHQYLPSPGVHHSVPPFDHRNEEAREDDESWRRPMPHAERRRAGKHTKRMVVKS